MDPQILITLLVPALPFAAFLIIAGLTRKFPMASGLISILAMAGSLALSIIILMDQIAAPRTLEFNIPWLFLGKMEMSVGALLNPLTSVMLMVVTTVSFLVQVYSVGYMRGDKGFARFFAFISLFSFSMLGLVISDNFVQLYIFWELVGLCSYLLISFWYEKPEAAAAGKKAFVVTRFGDFGFLVGIILLSYYSGTFNFNGARAFVEAGSLGQGLTTVIVLLLFCGAVGKSGQFPLHVWLPDAMEGPTPVSALIHAATMVAAGVFMVARLFPIFSSSPDAMLVIACLGGFTAFFSASIALVQDDIKRVLAYSTLSQLGYMMLALGLGGYGAGMFHLTTHAAFKALLFLCAGSVIHACHTNNVWEMGGLGGKMPVTAVTFLVGMLALSGIFPFSGFFSKDEILLVALNSGHTVLFAAALATAFMTAFYMSRIFFITFTGESTQGGHPHESPAVMTVPLIVLAALSVVAGFFTLPGLEKGEIHLLLALSSNAVAFAGILLAAVIYYARAVDPARIRDSAGFLYTLLKNKYYIDEMYLFIIRKVVYVVSEAIAWGDRRVVDGAVNLVAFLCRFSGEKLRYSISGRVQNYALILFSGVTGALLAMYFFGRGWWK